MKKKLILPNHVKEYRKQYNISADQLAQAIGISRVALYSIENHKAGPTAFHAGLICQYFGCKFEEMFDIDDLKMADEKEEQIPGQMEIPELDLLTTDQILDEINKRTGLVFRKEKTDTYFIKLKKLTLTFSIGPFFKLKDKEDTFILCGSHWSSEDTFKTCYTISDAVEYFSDKLKEYTNERS